MIPAEAALFDRANAAFTGFTAQLRNEPNVRAAFLTPGG